MRDSCRFPNRIAVDLSFAPPHAERLSRIIPGLAAHGVSELVIDWESVFPWTIDGRMSGPGAFTEEAVAGVCEVIQRSGVTLIPRLARGGLIRALDRVPSFAHFTGLAYDPQTLREYAAAGVRMAERVWDDLCSIGGEPSIVILGVSEAPADSAALFRELVTEPVAERIATDGMSVHIEGELPPRWDGPVEMAIAATVDSPVGGGVAFPAATASVPDVVADILAVAALVAELDAVIASGWGIVRRVSDTLAWAVRDPGMRQVVAGHGTDSDEVTGALADLHRVRERLRERLGGGMDIPVVADYLSRRCAAVEELLVVLSARLRALG
ncbi:MAG: hypothetical protein EA403_07810 [Spirochaetaceae bacterium]|nr:MAG: hypothetical protein EA403_07810 [Spirochaetaceae bacterium]